MKKGPAFPPGFVGVIPAAQAALTRITDAPRALDA